MLKLQKLILNRTPINEIFNGELTKYACNETEIALFELAIDQEVLNPPYYNIAEGRKVHATGTCGEGVGKEPFCKIVGSTWPDLEIDYNYTVVRGQACDVCDPNNPKKTHSANYVTDGTSKWWQSPPLSRGPEAAQVNLTIDLGQFSSRTTWFFWDSPLLG
uniref:Laminin N-terminal domain-containing protein n=1 Tax=Tetranychus urticae TaxID=32264 RepID=T1KF64_TETUR